MSTVIPDNLKNCSKQIFGAFVRIVQGISKILTFEILERSDFCPPC